MVKKNYSCTTQIVVKVYIVLLQSRIHFCIPHFSKCGMRLDIPTVARGTSVYPPDPLDEFIHVFASIEALIFWKISMDRRTYSVQILHNQTKKWSTMTKLPLFSINQVIQLDIGITSLYIFLFHVSCVSQIHEGFISSVGVTVKNSIFVVKLYCIIRAMKEMI